MSDALCARLLLERLLPVLLSAMASFKADADMRFSCLKVMSDLLALLLDLSADGDATLTSSPALKQILVVPGFAPYNMTIKCKRYRPSASTSGLPKFYNLLIQRIVCHFAVMLHSQAYAASRRLF